jgi:hypothetical protein
MLVASSNPRDRSMASGSKSVAGMLDQAKLIARLKRLSRAELGAMYNSAVEATDCIRALAESGANPVTKVLAGTDVVEEWAHFPLGDVFDPHTHGQYYYHAHAAHERVANEHGHFHTFVRPKRLFPELAPATMPDRASFDDEGAWIAHLVGISTDASGRVIRLFTTNRWVTGEVWYDGEDVIRMLERFEIAVDQPSHDLNRWVTAMVQMFRPQIVDLIRARDLKVAQYQAAHPECAVFEDRALQVTSEMPVDFLAQIRAIETVISSME